MWIPFDTQNVLKYESGLSEAFPLTPTLSHQGRGSKTPFVMLIPSPGGGGLGWGYWPAHGGQPRFKIPERI